MLCPQCRQPVQEEELTNGECPYCGFPCEEFSRRLTVVQVILAALFLSTLVLGVVVAFLELQVGYHAPGLGTSEFVLGMALMGASVGILFASLRFEARARDAETLQTYKRMIIILAGIAEMPAVFGLVMYMLAGSLQWMVMFLLVSWALMIRLGLRLPDILRGMVNCLSTR